LDDSFKPAKSGRLNLHRWAVINSGITFAANIVNLVVRQPGVQLSFIKNFVMLQHTLLLVARSFMRRG